MDRADKRMLVGLALFFTAGSAAITFQGGCMPHWVDVGNGETVVAYSNGVVYTNPPGAGFPMGKRTLWQAKDGAIKSSFSVVGPTVRSYFPATLPATPQEVAKWEKAQEVLAKND